MDRGGEYCELCGGDAAVRCPSDSAFLCWSCDAKVHSANFLVARHFRFTVCSNCKSVTGNRVSGIGAGPFSDLCSSCSPEDDDKDLDSVSSSTSSSSSSAACVSSTDRSAAAVNGGSCCRKSRRLDGTVKRAQRISGAVDPAAEGVFVNWCARLGIGGGEIKEKQYVTRKACGALRVCLAHMTGFPFRVSLAASLWFGLRRCAGKPVHTWRALRRLEQISGVPAKIIISAESKLQLLEKAGKPRRQWLTEGWDECSA